MIILTEKGKRLFGNVAIYLESPNWLVLISENNIRKTVANSFVEIEAMINIGLIEIR